MQIEAIKVLLDAVPFVPFTIHMADGQSYYIDHPDFVGISRGGRTLMVSTTGERFALLDTNLISRMESDNATAGA